MNATLELSPDDGLLRLVDFKWLMAGLGWRVDLTRLQRDTAYAAQCVQRGLASGSDLLRQRSVELLPSLARMSAHGRSKALIPERAARRVVQ